MSCSAWILKKPNSHPLIFFLSLSLIFSLFARLRSPAQHAGKYLPNNNQCSQIRSEALIQNMCASWGLHAAEKTVSAYPDTDLNQDANTGATLLDSTFKERIMFSSNETLEIPLWRSSSCGRMKDVFGLQCQFLQTACVWKEENSRPEGFKPYFITPPGYLSPCSRKHPLNLHSVHTINCWLDAAGQNTKPLLWITFQTNIKILLFLLPGICQFPVFLHSPLFHVYRIFHLSRTILRFVHAHSELGRKSICVLWLNNLSSSHAPASPGLAALTPAPISSSLHFSFSILPPPISTP